MNEKSEPVREAEKYVRKYYERRNLTPPESNGRLEHPDAFAVYQAKTGYSATRDEFVYDAVTHYPAVTHEGNIPKWLWAAQFAVKRYYVGYTSDLYRRQSEHAMADLEERSAAFFKVFLWDGLVQVEWYDDKETAKREEERYADSLRDNSRGEGVFVYQQ